MTATKTTYSSDNAVVDARWSQEMKPVSERQSATDGKPFFIEDVQGSAEGSHGQQMFLDTLEQRAEGHIWSVDAECAQGASLAKAEKKAFF